MYVSACVELKSSTPPPPPRLSQLYVFRDACCCASSLFAFSLLQIILREIEKYGNPNMDLGRLHVSTSSLVPLGLNRPASSYWRGITFGSLPECLTPPGVYVHTYVSSLPECFPSSNIPVDPRARRGLKIGRYTARPDSADRFAFFAKHSSERSSCINTAHVYRRVVTAVRRKEAEETIVGVPSSYG